MTKKLIVLSAIVLVIAFSATVLAATQKATLINTNGDKVVVAAGSSEAQYYFGKGYVLMGADFTALTNQCVNCPEVGALPGGDLFQRLTVHDKVIDGGKLLNASTTLTVAKTLTAAQVCSNNVITVNSAATAAATLAAASLDITLPATSTLFATCLKEEGAHISFLFANLSPTAASTTQIVAGAGMDLEEPDDSSAFDVEIAGGARAKIDIWRMDKGYESNLDAVVLVTDMSAAD